MECFVPHKTQSYACTSSPPVIEPPYCVVKSFPSLPEHTASWAKAKVLNLLKFKPLLCQQLLIVKQCNGNASLPSGAESAGKLLDMIGMDPSWLTCVTVARLKFEKYFSYKALQLLTNFPPDTIDSSGELFWSWPKQIPKPLVFNENNPDHVEFVSILSEAFASIVGIMKDCEIRDLLDTVTVPPFVPKNKLIVTDENVSANDVQSQSSGSQWKSEPIYKSIDHIIPAGILKDTALFI